jgi:hypothetical protein
MTSSKMLSSKISTSTFIDNKKIYNILKIIFLLILLLIFYMYFTNNITYKNFKNNNLYEGFVANAQGYTHFGNVISLKNQLNEPSYTANQCIFELDDVYRIDTLQFNFNSVNSNGVKYGLEQSIFIQYADGDGNMRYLKSRNRSDSPPSIHSGSKPTILGSGTATDEYYILLTNITDENNLPVYTSKIVILIGSSSADYDSVSLNEYTDVQGYISRFGIFGGPRTLLTRTLYDSIAKKLMKVTTNTSTPVTNTETQTSIVTYNNIGNSSSDMKIYSLRLLITQTPAAAATDKPTSCFTIKVQYTNSIYLMNTFNINTTYNVRSDIHKLVLTPPSVFIFFDEPIIASKFIFTINNLSNYTLTTASLTINCSTPSPDDIVDFKRNANSIINSSSNDNSDVCPNINDLLEKQTKTQSICDNLEFQDKVKSEKLRLERNKQYLLKLKNQQEKIDQLNDVIQELESKRAARAEISDQAKLLQYQTQKENVSTIRDLANQRLESQDKNKLYMNMNLNYS